MGLDTSLGIRIGRLEQGPRNLISDVAGVWVGHCTLDEGAVQTGVTVVLPHPGNTFEEKLPAAAVVFNGFGKSAGLMQVEELGQLETPVALTNTLSVGTAWTALCRLMLEGNPGIGREAGTVNPVVMECNDGYLSDIRGMHVGEGHVRQAAEAASESFEEGSVGAGRGMRCHGLKGGIGSSSRVFRVADESYVLGALALCNHGLLDDFVIMGQPVGGRILELLRRPEPGEDKGSVIIVLATDLPMGAAQLKRVARRALAGLSRTGSNMGHGSGEIALAFSTGNRIRPIGFSAFRHVRELDEGHIDLPFRAAAEAVEEAVLSALFNAAAVTGRDGHRAEALSELFKRL